MKDACAFVPALLLAASASVLAQDAPQPNYPPGYDCASVPAGSQREACEQSQLSPKINDGLNNDRPVPDGEQETLGTVSPPTISDEPDNESRDSGPGTEGGAGGVGN